MHLTLALRRVAALGTPCGCNLRLVITVHRYVTEHCVIEQRRPLKKEYNELVVQANLTVGNTPARLMCRFQLGHTTPWVKSWHYPASRLAGLRTFQI